jgi:hypothetical protein
VRHAVRRGGYAPPRSRFHASRLAGLVDIAHFRIQQFRRIEARRVLRDDREPHERQPIAAVPKIQQPSSTGRLDRHVSTSATSARDSRPNSLQDRTAGHKLHRLALQP